MNGYQCGDCGCEPCRCSERRRKQRIKDGGIVIESMWQAMVHLPRWKMKIVRWLWPDIIHVANDLKEYYWSDQDDQS